MKTADETSGYLVAIVTLLVGCFVTSILAASDGSIRLVGGNCSSEGRVEVFRDGDWGTVCDDSWGLRDAAVACRQLGHRSASAALSGSFGPGTGPILLDEVGCAGDEAALADCPHADWGVHDCTHGEDVGVVCSNATNTTLPFPDEEVTYRLFGGASRNEGVLQLRGSPGEAWNTLCLAGAHLFPDVGAEICRRAGRRFFCRSETFGSRDRADVDGRRGELGASPLKWAGPACRGTSRDDVTCVLTPFVWEEERCTVEGALWLVCDTHLDFSLGLGVLENEGVLRVRCNNNDSSAAWRGVCGDRWLGAPSTHAHRAACRHLGYANATRPVAYTVPRQSPLYGVDVLLQGVECDGSEGEQLEDCPIRQPLFEGCSSLAGVKCNAYGMELMLAQSHFPGGGFVIGRLGLSDEWGALCGNADYRDTDLICRQLGFATSVSVTSRPKPDADALPAGVLVSAVGCTGSEAELSQCALQPGVGASCTPKTNLYVECQEETSRFDTPAYLCGEIHYCGYDCKQGRRDSFRPLREETCKCDDACAFFEDCCYDYRSNCDPPSDWTKAQLNGVTLPHYACVWTPGQSGRPRYANFGWALVSRCPDSWSVPFVRETCERVTADDDDVIGSLPVYDSDGAVYRNVFCAICHGVEPGHLQKWNASLEYRYSGNTTFDSRLNVTKRRFVYEPPGSGSLGTARTCPARTVGSCRPEFTNTTLEAACEDYFAPIQADEVRYRNPHCAMCNDLAVEAEASCGPLCTLDCSEEDPWQECSAVCAPSGNLPTVAALFDFGWGGGEGSECRSGELYDPFLGRCRAVTCASGAAGEDGRCAPARPEVPALPAPPSAEMCSSLVNESLGGDAASYYWQAVPLDPRAADGGAVRIEILARRFDSVGDLGSRLLPVLELNATDAQPCNIESVAVYIVDGGVLSAVESCANASVPARGVFQARDGNYSGLDFEVFSAYLWDKRGTRYDAAPTACLGILGMNCQEVIVLKPDEFASGASSIRLTSTGSRFEGGDFVSLPNGTAAVCGPLGSTDPGEFALWVVSLICSGLSLLAMAATFVVYSAVPALRNAAGLYTMNLVAALFVAVLAVAVAGALDAAGTPCVAFASLTHLAWLSAFLWMATLSFNAARTFGARVPARRSGASRRRSAAVMLSVWGAASATVAACAALTLCDCTGLPQVYRRSAPCLVASGTVLLVVLGGPVLASLLVSLACFAVVVVGVRRTKRTSKMVQSRSEAREAVDEVKIYAKLALLFGLTWLLAFVAAAVDHVVLSYLNVVVNTLQGFFIFVAFCLNRRVRALWRKGRRAAKGAAAGGLRLAAMPTSGSASKARSSVSTVDTTTTSAAADSRQ